jgi:hypothetical protein
MQEIAQGERKRTIFAGGEKENDGFTFSFDIS